MVLEYVPLVLATVVLAVAGLSTIDRRVARPVNRIAYRAFDGWNIEPDPRRERVLRSAGIGTPYSLYAAKTYLLAAVGAAAGVVYGFYLGGLLLDLFPGIPDLLQFYRAPFGIHSPDWLSALVPPELVVVGAVVVVTGLFMGGGASLGIYIVRWKIPAVRAGTRRRQIDAGMPRMVAFIYALSRGGMAVPDVMRALSRNRGVFGTSAEEMGVGVRNIDLFGYDLVTAMRDLAHRTPSEQFQKFTENMTSVLQSGQDLSAFLRNEYERYSEEAEDQQREILDLLAATAEVYVTVVVAGMLFLITILLVIGVTSGGMLPLIELITYVVLPATNVLFIAYLSEITQPLRASRDAFDTGEDEGLSPTGGPSVDRAAVADGGEPSAARRASSGERSEPDGGERFGESRSASALASTARRAENRARFDAYRTLQALRSTVSNPFESVLERPTLLLYVTIPIAVVFLVLQLPAALTPDGFAIRVYDDAVILATLFVLGTFGLVYEVHQRRLEQLEESVPDLLERLASLNEAGVAVVTSFERVRESDLGDLDPEVDRIWRDIQWGANVTEALERFETRVGTPAVTRVVTLTTNAMRASNDIGPVLRIAAEQARSDRRLKRRRKQEMFTYLLIIYVAFIVFLVVIGAINSVLIPNLPTSTPSPDVSAIGGGPFMGIGDVDVDAYQLAFFHAGIIQATLSGLVGGQMGGGSIKDGVKHAAVMLGLAYVAFALLSSLSPDALSLAVPLP